MQQVGCKVHQRRGDACVDELPVERLKTEFTVNKHDFDGLENGYGQQ